MGGQGVDRHIFGLYVVSVGRDIDSPFLKSALSDPWKLSTSQTPPQQTDDPRPRPECAGGGFGPVAEDGYGVSYMPLDSGSYFHVSSKVSASNTDSKRFAAAIQTAMADMEALL